MDNLTFHTSNPDWEMAPKLVEAFDSVTAVFQDFVGSPIKSQEVTFIFQVTPGTMDFGKATAALVNTQLLGEAEFFGVTVNTSERSLHLERSVKYKGGAFFRLTRVFEPAQKFADVALALHTDETSALKLIGVEELA